MEKKPEVLYGYKVMEDGDSLEGWRITRVLQEVLGKRGERNNDSSDY